MLLQTSTALMRVANETIRTNKGRKLLEPGQIVTRKTINLLVEEGFYYIAVLTYERSARQVAHTLSPQEPVRYDWRTGMCG